VLDVIRNCVREDEGLFSAVESPNAVIAMVKLLEDEDLDVRYRACTNLTLLWYSFR